MTARVLIGGLFLSTLVACVPSESIQCPDATEEVTGSCVVACLVDDECLIGEVCDPTENACVSGLGDRPVITELRADTSPVARGRPVHLFYSAERATRVTIDHDVLASSAKLSGDVWTKAINDTTVFEIVAFGPGGRTRRAVAVTVTDAPTAPTIVRFSMTPEHPRPGEVATINWDVAGARRVRVMQGNLQIHSTMEPRGSIAYIPTGADSTLTLIAENDAGESRAEISILVLVNGPEIDSFDASTASAVVGDRLQLSWRTAGALTMEILSDGTAQLFRSDDVALVALGAHMVTMPAPAAGQTQVKFTLVVTGNDGSKAAKDIVISIQHN